MNSNRMALLIAALMIATSFGAVVARPRAGAVSPGPTVSLETMIPKQFGAWREAPEPLTQIINPELQKFIDEVYSEVLNRVYVNAEGYRIMLSLAHSSDQRGNLRAHDPERCYVAQGFVLHSMEESSLATPFGELSLKRLFTTRGPRNEPVTYWLTVGGKAIARWQLNIIILSFTLTGRIPDGYLFRVSSIDQNQNRAIQLQDQFINQLLKTLSPTERKRLTGLGNS